MSDPVISSGDITRRYLTWHSREHWTAVSVLDFALWNRWSSERSFTNMSDLSCTQCHECLQSIILSCNNIVLLASVPISLMCTVVELQPTNFHQLYTIQIHSYNNVEQLIFTMICFGKKWLITLKACRLAVLRNNQSHWKHVCYWIWLAAMMLHDSNCTLYPSAAAPIRMWQHYQPHSALTVI